MELTGKRKETEAVVNRLGFTFYISVFELENIIKIIDFINLLFAAYDANTAAANALFKRICDK